MPRYEVEISLFVVADTEDQALDIVSDLMYDTIPQGKVDSWFSYEDCVTDTDL